MNLSKVSGQNTRDALCYLNKRIDILEQKININHQETKELINDTNLNFMDNEKCIEREMIKEHDMDVKILDIIQELSKRMEDVEKMLEKLIDLKKD